LLLFEGTFTLFFKDKKSKKVTKYWESRFFSLFLHDDRRIRIRPCQNTTLRRPWTNLYRQLGLSRLAIYILAGTVAAGSSVEWISGSSSLGQSGYGSGSRGFDDQKLDKIYS
jgi:hypothetical protein